MLKASVIVPARDASATLARTLEALAGQELDGDYEIVVVDDGSSDATGELARSSGVPTRVIELDGRGAGNARNAGATAARAPVLAFIDADCWPTPQWLAHGLAALEELDLVQGRVVPNPERQVGPFDRTLAVVSAHGLFESANLFLRRELFHRAGGFPAGLETGRWEDGRAASPFGEDVVFGWRARRLGAKTGFCEAALAYHEVFSRGPIGFISERNRLALFPALARAVPELRDVFFYRRIFINRRSAAFDLAVAGLALAVMTRRRPIGALAAPYAALVTREARRWGGVRGLGVAMAGAAADVVGGLALVRGSLRARQAVL